MATDAGAAPRPTTPELTAQWRSLARAATFVAVLTSPAVFVWLHNRQGRHWQEKPVISGDEEKRPLFDLPRNEEEAQQIRDEKFSHWLPKTKQKTDE